MKLLEDRIVKDGIVLEGNVLKVGSFLNHQIDVALLMEMCKEVKRLYDGVHVTKLLTAEASGIAIATAFGAVMDVPVLFAKKNRTSNLSGSMYSASVHSYTHNRDYTIVVEKQFLTPDDSVIIVDDFLANGAALEGLCDVVRQSGATLAGCAIEIEKGFQRGGDKLREKGVRVDSLAIIESMENGKIVFRP